MAITDLFAAALKHYRELSELSQEELAAKAGLDRTYVSQLERGLKSPTLNSLEKIAACLGVAPQRFLRKIRGVGGPRVPRDYFVRDIKEIEISRRGGDIGVPATTLTMAINVAHELIDDLYASDLDVAAVLGLRNLSAFIGELVSAAVVKSSAGLFLPNPHQDGYPDLLLMDRVGKREWDRLQGRRNEKTPFSPFASGGIEIKATCGSVPTPAVCKRRGIERPVIGARRVACLTSYYSDTE